jgi:hypothetical protein
MTTTTITTTSSYIPVQHWIRYRRAPRYRCCQTRPTSIGHVHHHHHRCHRCCCCCCCCCCALSHRRPTAVHVSIEARRRCLRRRRAPLARATLVSCQLRSIKQEISSLLLLLLLLSVLSHGWLPTSRSLPRRRRATTAPSEPSSSFERRRCL